MLYHPDTDEFIASSGSYGALGKAIVSLSNLEFAHDEFVFRMHETHRKLSVGISKRFPRHFRNKTDFLINSVFRVPKLRQIPFSSDGWLDLLWLQYQMDEIYEIRTVIAHGSIALSETTPDRVTWILERFLNVGKNTWSREAVKVSNGFLASVFYSAWALKHYLIRLTMCLEKTSCWEQAYQIDKDIRRNEILFAKMVSIETGLGQNE